MKNQKISVILRCCAFFLVTVLVFTWLADNLKEHSLIDTSENGIFRRPRNSVDILYVGSSHVYAAVKPSQIEEKTGLKGFDLTSSDMNAEAMYYYLKAALRFQNPRYVALETYSFSIYEKDDAPSRLNTSFKLLDLPFRDRAAFVADRAREGDKDFLYVLFPIVLFHENWSSPENFGRPLYSADNGWYPFPDDPAPVPLADEPVRQTARPAVESGETSAESEYYFDKIMEMLRDRGISVIFFTTPYYLEAVEYPVYEELREYADDNHIPFLNMAEDGMLEKLDLRREDMHDGQHVSEKGAAVVSDCLAEFLLSLPEQGAE